MRFLLILSVLCFSLAACTVSARPKIVVPRPSQTEVAPLYIALAWQVEAHKLLLDTADTLQVYGISPGTGVGTVLGAAVVMKLSGDLLNQDFPPSLSSHVQIGKIQLHTLRDIATRWAINKTITTHDAEHELSEIDAAAVLRRYEDKLVKLGWTYGEIETMRLKLKADLAKAIGATPAP